MYTHIYVNINNLVLISAVQQSDSIVYINLYIYL